MNNFTFGNARHQYYETIARRQRPRAACSTMPTGSIDWRVCTARAWCKRHMTNSRLTDPEVLEFRFPVRLESYAIRQGSGGGRGSWRGGGWRRAAPALP